MERLIEAGRVALNGQVLTTPAVKVEAGDILTVDGKVVNEAEPARLFRYHRRGAFVARHGAIWRDPGEHGCRPVPPCAGLKPWSEHIPAV